MVRTRLARRLRALKFKTFDEYCDHIRGPAGADELGMMISALTTNVSHFFREDHHFAMLREKVLPGLIQKAKSGQRVRIWSAGCSNGQEPYSIAMTLLEAGMPPGADMRILATDIDPNVVAHAREGIYPDSMATGIPDDLRRKYFLETTHKGETAWQAVPDLKAPIAFRVLNLLHDWPMHGSFDAIFCRNVVIYFDAETQDRLWSRFAKILRPGGWLFLGHSERISPKAMANFTNCGVTAYQRNGDTTSPGSAAPTRSGT
jgi:chemotaxis protein methyltransferase CheR